MDQNEANIPEPESLFSFQRLLCEDDWFLWDTFPTVDGDNDDDDDVNSPDPSIMISLGNTLVDQWFESLPIEHFATLINEYVDEEIFSSEAMDQNGDNILASESLFSFQRLLCEDDWFLWDTFPAADDDNDDDDDDVNSPDSSVVIPLENTLVDQWFESLSIEHFTTLINEYVDEEIFSYEELVDLTEHIGNVSIGLNVEFIDEKLSRRKYEACTGEMENCVICLDKIKHNEEASKLKCDHDFHFECIKEWLMVKNMCPLCKQKVL